MSNTPRTDELLAEIGPEFVLADIKELEDFARDLECENAGFKTLIEQMKCCGNCTDCYTFKSKAVCRTCTRNPYGSQKSDNWSMRGGKQWAE